MDNEKITKAKIGLILTQPFFATLALSLKFEADETIKTACTDGVSLKYNSKFIEGLTLQQTKGLIAHEVMHVAFLHHTRRQNRDITKWNKSCDYAINQIILDSGFELPAGGCVDPSGAYKDLSAEQIYKMLPDEPKDKNGKGKGDGDPGGDGGVVDAPGKTEVEKKQAESEAKQLLSRAAMVAKQRGKLPGAFEHLIEKILEPIVNWKDVLNEYLTEKTRSDYTFSKPSKRYLSQGLYLPSLQTVERGKFILVIDTSGSIDEQLLNDFGGEMQSILSEVAENVIVYYVDTKIQKIDEFEQDEEMVLQAKGRGGTDFKPAFDHIEKNGVDCAALVYFTDGECNSFPNDPGFPVLWGIYGNDKFKPPFGEVVKVS